MIPNQLGWMENPKLDKMHYDNVNVNFRRKK